MTRTKRENSLHFHPLLLGGSEEGWRRLRCGHDSLVHPIDKVEDFKDSHHASSKQEGKDSKKNRVGDRAKGQHDVVSLLPLCFGGTSEL